MNQHVSQTARRMLPSQLLASANREAIVKSMAEHLAAAVIADRLDISNDIDVIDTLWRTPEQWQSRVILNHFDDAVFECRQILVAQSMGGV